MKSFNSWVIGSLVGLFVMCGLVSAQTIGGGLAVGAVVGAFGGSVSGNAGSQSIGNAVAASQVNGYGASFQQSQGVSNGSAAIGGTISPTGVAVFSGTSQFAQTQSVGAVSGNAPINVGDSIANGSAAFASTNQSAGVTSQFGAGAIGAGLAIGGIASIGSIH